MPTGDEEPAEEDDNEGLLNAVAQVIRGLRDWDFPSDEPPVLRGFLEGDFCDWNSLSLRISLHAREVGKNGHVVEEVSADGTVTPNLVSLSSVRARDAHGGFEGRLDYDFWGREGRFDLTSSVNISLLLRSWLDWPGLEEMEFEGSQEIESEGGFRFPDEGPPLVRLTGRAQCRQVRLHGVPFDTADGLFSWRDGQLYLRDLHLRRPDGEARGKILFGWPMVQQNIRTTLPLDLHKPFFKDEPLEEVLNDFKERPGASLEVSVDGGYDASRTNVWAYTGKVRLRNMSYRGVPLNSAKCDLTLTESASTYSNGEVEFDYRDYPLRKAHGGPERGTLRVDSIHHDEAADVITVKGLRGTAWPAPVVRTFDPGLADDLEIYRFTRPPALSASGVVDLGPRNRSNLTVDFQSGSPAYYEFLGAGLALREPRARVVLRGAEVLVRDLRARVCGGAAKVDVKVGADGMLDIHADCEELEMEQINKAYDLGFTAGGLVTGGVRGRMAPGKIETLDGQGLVMIERTVLFSAPTLGPLSRLLAKIVGEKRAGFEKAKGAFATFTVRKGVVHTKDFHTSTASLVFAGDGTVNLADAALDFNIRVNARGLLGVVTFPLKPIKGLFQFRGTGTLLDPVWDNAKVTDPLPEQRTRLFGKPDPEPARIPRAIPVEDEL